MYGLLIRYAMKISGFTFIKNATKLFFPVKESILSILPIVDEFIIALGDCDPDDRTREEINSIGSEKIKIIDTVWDESAYPKSTIFAQQTDIAKENCKGDWLFYLQSDEVVHEKYLPEIVKCCKQYFNDSEVEGLLFKYKHFWGDFNHYHMAHNWYPKEIRIIRNHKAIHSWRDAQSFRRFFSFDYSARDYLKKTEAKKLNVAEVDAFIFHYGWVRPPYLMSKKQKNNTLLLKGEGRLQEINKKYGKPFDYGPLNQLKEFKGKHPKVMENWIKQFDWEDQLQYSGKRSKGRPIHKHEKFKYKLITFIEQNFLNGRQIGGFKNYNIIR